VDQDKH